MGVETVPVEKVIAMDVLGIGGTLGWQELILVLLIVMLLFGAKRLPEIARSMGKSMKEFKDATKGLADDVKSGLDEDEDEKPRTSSENRASAEHKDE